MILDIFLKTIAFIVAGPLFPGIFLLGRLPKKWNNWKSLVTGATLSYCVFGVGFAWLTISNPLAALIVGCAYGVVCFTAAILNNNND